MRPIDTVALCSWSLSLVVHAAAFGAAWHWQAQWGADRRAELDGRSGVVTVMASAGGEPVAASEPTLVATPTAPSHSLQASDVSPTRQMMHPVITEVTPQDEPILPLVATTDVPAPPTLAEAEAPSTEQPEPASPVRRRNAAQLSRPPGSSAVQLESGVTSATDPQFSQNVPPEYPREALARHWQGTVLLRLLIDESGQVTSARVERSSGYTVLDDAALHAVRNWRARPALHNGRPVATTELQPIVFRLR